MQTAKGPFKVLIITDHKIHAPLAQANRILSYAKSLMQVGCPVEIMVYRTSSDPIPANVGTSGHIEGVPYRYSSGSTVRSTRFLSRRLQDAIGVLHCLRAISRGDKRTPTAAIFYTINPFSELLLLMACKARHILTAKELSEHPSVYFRHRGWPGTLLESYYRKFGLRPYTHHLVMTETLGTEIRPMIGARAQVLTVPMTVDLARFTATTRTEGIPYIGYAGQLNEAKDGVVTLIKAFALLAKRQHTVELHLAGAFSSAADDRHCRKAIMESGYQHRIRLLGQLSRSEIPQFLVNARALVLARPDSLQARMGFPTKLGEYLASGVPVVVTRVGEIPLFLQNGVSAMLIQPDSISELADSLEAILTHPALAKSIGEQGKSVALQIFDGKNQAARVLSFLFANRPQSDSTASTSR